jgi:P4 family phage/plasmid primase-like protien
MVHQMSVKPIDFSDAGNAQVLAAAFKGMLAYCDALGWLYFNGKYWERNDHQAVDIALHYTDEMLDEASAELEQLYYDKAGAELSKLRNEDGADARLKLILEKIKTAQAYKAHATRSRMASRVRGMLDLAIPSLHIKADKLDADPLILNTPDGVVDLRTGELRTHDVDSPYLWCTKMTTVTPGDEGMLQWVNFLQVVTCGSVELAQFLQLVAGVALVGRVYHEGIFIAVGSGRNGKSTFFNALLSVLGDYGGTIDVDVLTTDRQNRGAALATLRGKRLVLASELEEHKRLSVSTLKQIASTDKLTVEEKYKAPETVEQSHTLVLFTNFMPRVGSTDQGTWRRITVIPFRAVISLDEDIPNYTEKLVKEAGPAILKWAIAGAVSFCKNGFRLNIPETVAEATEAYRARENWLENFISERCVKEPGVRVGARDLYLEYKDWAAEAGEYVRRENDFSAAMEAAGYQKIAPKNKRTWIGLRLPMTSDYSNRWGATG